MSKWPMVKLGDINNYTSKSVNPMNNPKQIFELYSVPSFDNDYPEIISGEKIGSSKITVEKNDVLLCKINPRINRVWVVEKYTENPLIASSEWIVIRNSKVLPRYLLWCLRSEPFRGKLVTNVTGIGGSLTRVQPKQVAEYAIPLPPFDKQRKIAATLDAAAELLKLRKEQLAELDKLVKSQFIEMFGDPVMNPKGWPLVPLLETGTCKNGMNFGSHETGVEIHCLGVGDFKDLSVIDAVQNLPTISLSEMPSSEYLLRDEDIVFVRSNGNSALVGRCLAIYPGNTQTTFSGFCIRYRKNTDSLLTEYLLQTFKTPSVRQQMFGRGANIQNLNQQILSQLNIPMPPLELQNQFAAFVQQVDKSKFVIQQCVDETQGLFDSLMNEYFDKR